MNDKNLPQARWTVRRGKGRRFEAHKGDAKIPLRGIRRQIERNHFPYHLVKRRIPPWIQQERMLWNGSRLLGLKDGRLFDREVENAVRHDCEHVVFGHLKELDLFPIAAKILATNAELNQTEEASCAEIDLVAFNRTTGCFACVEIKRTAKCMQRLEKEEQRSPRCRRTKRKRHFLDMARLQAQLGALFLENTYDLEKVEPYLLILSKDRNSDIVDDVNLFKLDTIDKIDVKWVLGYDDKDK